MTRQALVVDAVPGDRVLAATLLRRAGWLVHEAPDATSALALATQSRLDAVLLGPSRPGPEGLTLLRALRADPVLALLPVAVSSVYVMRGERAAAVAAGCRGWIEKPIDPDALAVQLAAVAATAEPGGPA